MNIQQTDFQPGSLFVKNKEKSSIRLYRIPFNAIELINSIQKKQTYQHHLVVDDFVDINDSNEDKDFLFLLHFFTSPNYIQYYPNQDVVENINNKYPCVAYFLYNNSIWASNIYKSKEEFLEHFEIVME